MAASGSTSMNKTVKTLAALASATVVLSFVVVVINQTALDTLDCLWRIDRRSGRDGHAYAPRACAARG
jgi:hypothetical protein